MTKDIIEKLRKKATQSVCTYKVSALGFNRRGECVISTVNRPALSKKGGGVHAEESIFKVAKKKGIVKILICRVGRSGILRPIEACPSCSRTASKLGIEIISILD